MPVEFIDEKTGRSARPTGSSADGQGLTRNNGWPNSMASPLFTRIAVIVPLTSAGIWLKTFIASSRQTIVSGVTTEPTVTNAGSPGVGDA